MSEEPSLPRLPAVLWDEQSQSFSNNPRKRVRARTRSAQPLVSNSSDPAVFSSDDDPGLDNYVEGRHKKRYVGSWFQQQPASSDSAMDDGSATLKPKGKRTLARQLDSGVFLGSDGNDSEDIMESLEVPLRPRLPQLEQRAQRHISEAELAARDKIRTCIEQGNESLDLWSMGLEEISNETIGRLSQVACIPVVSKDVAFEQKDPELKILIAMNRLTRVPGALFDLTHLTTLSLRGNKLTELPSGISKLRKLRELNVAQNRLRHLPIELFDLIHDGVDDTKRLKTLIVHPNPFLRADREFELEKIPVYFSSPKLSTEMEIEECLKDWSFVSRHLGRSPLQSSSSSGAIQSSFKLPSTMTSALIPVEAPATKKDVPELAWETSSLRPAVFKPSRVASLFETALRSCYQSDELPELPDYMPEDLSHLRHILGRAAQQKEAGGVVCSRCRKLLVVPPLEWIEWRELATLQVLAPETSSGPKVLLLRPKSKAEGEMMLPFLHRACSWHCGPDHRGTDGQPVEAGWEPHEQELKGLRRGTWINGASI